MTTTNTTTTVKLIDAQLTEDKHELSGKSSTGMNGVLLLNNLEIQFTLWNDDYTYSKNIYSIEEIRTKLAEYTESFLTETEDGYYVNRYNITIQGMDLKQLKTLGITFDFSELYNKFRELKKENKELNKTLWIAKATKNYENNWYVNNVAMFNEKTPDGIEFTVNPSKDRYTDYNNKFSSEIGYTITLSYKTSKKEFTLVDNYTSSGSWSTKSSFTGYALKKNYDHCGLFKTTDGIIKRMKKEYDEFVETVENKIKEQKASASKISKIKNMFGGNVQSIIERKYSGEGRSRYSYDKEHFEVVFVKETKKNKYNNSLEQFGTGIKFTTEDFKTFRIIEIGGEFISGKMYQEFVNIIVNNFTFKKDVVITMNPISNPINEDGMRAMIEFIENKISSVELSNYKWKSLQS